jgi:hypothetical protein
MGKLLVSSIKGGVIGWNLCRQKNKQSQFMCFTYDHFQEADAYEIQQLGTVVSIVMAS